MLHLFCRKVRGLEGLGINHWVCRLYLVHDLRFHHDLFFAVIDTVLVPEYRRNLYLLLFDVE